MSDARVDDLIANVSRDLAAQLGEKFTNFQSDLDQRSSVRDQHSLATLTKGFHELRGVLCIRFEELEEAARDKHEELESLVASIASSSEPTATTCTPQEERFVRLESRVTLMVESFRNSHSDAFKATSDCCASQIKDAITIMNDLMSNNNRKLLAAIMDKIQALNNRLQKLESVVPDG